MTKDDFKHEIQKLIKISKDKGCKFVDITSKEVHENVGGYPGVNHNMPSCCSAMKVLMKSKDEILYQPPKGNGATLSIRYYL